MCGFAEIGGSFLSSFGGGLGKALGGGGGPNVSGATSGTYGDLNGSGWIVNLHGTQVGATASPTSNRTDPTARMQPAPVEAGIGGMTLVVVLAVGAVLLLMKRRK